MRIAFSGTHYTGKSSLIKALHKELPEYEVFEEPYWILSEMGRIFFHPPTVEEFEQQLDCSIDLIKKSSKNALFDGSPIDFLAYAMVISDEFYSGEWEAKIAKAMKSLDLVVFLPIENPDRILIPASEDKDLRSMVDEKPRELILEDSLEIVTTKVLEVKGSLSERLKQICSQIK
jgi:hypothetical protein